VLLDEEPYSMEEVVWTREKSIAAYWRIATATPEETRGSLTTQIEALQEGVRAWT
jgi:hypothetical protein